MADIDQLLLELRELQRKFELAIQISDFNQSFLVFEQLRTNGTVCLWRVKKCGYLRSIPGGPRALNLFDDLIGFCPSEHLTQGIVGSFWCVRAGLIDQPEVWTDIQSKQAPDEMAVWNKCGFQLLTGCANGLGRLIEIIEREVAADDQADSDDTDDGNGISPDGLYRSDALFVWKGKRYEWLTETMMDVLELLHKCYPDAVQPSAIEHKIGDIPEGGFKKVFRVNRKDQKGLHDVASIIGGRAPRGWFLIK
jgi:hypothetical protein